jgi:hypothetical protein
VLFIARVQSRYLQISLPRLQRSLQRLHSVSIGDLLASFVAPNIRDNR